MHMFLGLIVFTIFDVFFFVCVNALRLSKKKSVISMSHQVVFLSSYSRQRITCVSFVATQHCYLSESRTSETSIQSQNLSH